MSASVVVRKLQSVPVRTSAETWGSIVELLTVPGSSADFELRSATGVVSMLISDEVTSKAPIVLIPGVGARVRVYTLHGDAAIDFEGPEQPLAACPTSDDNWVISVPSSTEEIEWVRKSLASLRHFVVRDLSDGIEASAEPTAREMVVDARWLEE